MKKKITFENFEKDYVLLVKHEGEYKIFQQRNTLHEMITSLSNLYEKIKENLTFFNN